MKFNKLTLKPSIGLLLFLWILAIVGAFLLSCYVVANVNPMHREVPWHIQVRVCDKSNNAIAGVKVIIHATGKITAINNMFSVTPKEYVIETKSDKNGEFVLNLKASGFYADLNKEGFEDERAVYIYNERKAALTNQSITILMTRSDTHH
jgi:hypothetical protein